MPIDPLNTQFKRLLEKSGWTQSEAARQLELTTGTISQYMSGDTRPSLTTIKLFQLLVGDSEPVGLREDAATYGAPRALDQQERDFVNELRALSDDDRRKLMSHVIGIAQMIPKKQTPQSKGGRHQS